MPVLTLFLVVLLFCLFSALACKSDMANTVTAYNNTEIYKDKISDLSDQYIESILKIDKDESLLPENKKIIADSFTDMIFYIADNIEKPSNDDIDLLDYIFNLYIRLCTRYSVLPTLEVFSFLVSINNSTFSDWANGEYRTTSAHGKTVKKWFDICKSFTVNRLHNQAGTNANLIFVAKAAYKMSEAPQQIEIMNGASAPALSQENIKEIAEQAQKKSIPEVIEGLPDD